MQPTGSGLMAPGDFPIRSWTDEKQINGRMVNPPRFPEGHGNTSAAFWPAGNESGHVKSDPRARKSVPPFAVEKPTSVRGAKSVAS